MKTIAVLLSLMSQLTFGLFNPEKPMLCQGKFYTEEQAKTLHAEFAQKYANKKSW